MHYTVLRTCALNRVDPYSYLKAVLDNLAAGWPQQRIAGSATRRLGRFAGYRSVTGSGSPPDWLSAGLRLGWDHRTDT